MNSQALPMSNLPWFEPLQLGKQENKEPSSMSGLETTIEPTPINARGIHVVDKVSLTSWSPNKLFVSMYLSIWRQRGAFENYTTIKQHDAHLAQCHNHAVCSNELASDSSTDFASVKTDTKFVSTKIGHGAPRLQSPTQTSFRHRPYKQNLWEDRIQELVQFKRRFGHCLVQKNWDENVSLAQWVKRQRYQNKLRRLGQHSTMTEERIKRLNELGFVWSSHGASWEERYSELVAFQQDYGHCNVPSSFPEMYQLAVWVKCQRRQHKHNVMTKDRYHKLNALGFVWNHRKLEVEKKSIASRTTKK
jgi:Helicase associated domain